MNAPVIYIIDDEPQTVTLLMEYVELVGYEAKTFVEAESFFEETPSIPDGSMMVLDLNMPKMDGIEVMRQMVKTGKLLPLVLVSGYDSGILHSAEQLAKAYSIDIVATLAKPFTFKFFKEIVEKYAEKTEHRLVPRKALSVTASELGSAILNNQLVLHYQPQIKISSGELTGVEALVRWEHPEHGLIYPDLFIGLAEKSGLIADLTAQVIRMAMDQVLKWKSSQIEIPVSVNISAENITSLSLPEQLSNMLNKHQLEPTMLTLEVTESALMGQLVTSLDILTRLRMKKFHLSVDDFGTGYSSLSQLYRMPFSELKVDKSFVMNMLNDEDAKGIVKICIMLGHELNMRVVAEGVEDFNTFKLLTEMGCDIAQGYHIARPMAAEDILPWIKSH